MAGQFKIIVEGRSWERPDDIVRPAGRGCAYQLIEFDTRAEADIAYSLFFNFTSPVFERTVQKLYK